MSTTAKALRNRPTADPRRAPVTPKPVTPETPEERRANARASMAKIERKHYATFAALAKK